MNSIDVFWYAWPWFGLGAAVVMLVVLFATDACRSNDGPRWRDPVWLAWLMPAALMIHQFEEYGCHVSGGEYDMIATMATLFASNPIMAGANVPLLHFPLMNMVFAWVALPVAAILSKRNPVIGLSSYGFILANALVHVVSTIGFGVSPLESPGFFTGALGFVGLFVVMVLAVRKGSFMNGRALAIAIVCGIAGHLLLAAVYALSIVGGAPAVVIGDIAVSFAPASLAMAASGGLVMKKTLGKA